MESNILNKIHHLEKKKTKNQTNDDRTEVSKFRNNASQCTAAFAANIILFSYGGFSGFTTVLLAELVRDNTEINVSVNELTWFGSALFMLPVGAILIGMVTQLIGSRLTLQLSAVGYCISWTMFFYAKNSTTLLIAQGVGALFNIDVPCTTYILEISQPHLRSLLMSGAYFSWQLGALFTVTIATFLHWRIVAIAHLGIAIIGVLVMTFVPNSPYWLANRGKISEAEKSLIWLRGWSSLEDVKSEFITLTEVDKNKSTSTIFTESSNIQAQNRILFNIKPYLQKSFYLPLVTVIYMFTMRAFMGCDAIIKFAEVIYEKFNVPYAKYLTVAVYILDILGTVLYMSIVTFFGKRKLMHISLAGSGLVYFTISMSMILIRNGYWLAEGYVWVPAIGILLAIFINASGVNSIVLILNGELFPTRYRSIGVCIGSLSNNASLALMNKIYVYMVMWITSAGVFIFFSLATIIGLVTFYFIIPETEGKTLLEIEEYYTAKINKSNSDSKKPEQMISVSVISMS